MLHEGYALEFDSALDRSVRWKHLNNEWREMPDGLPPASAALPVVRKFVEILPYGLDEIRRNCAGVHFGLYHSLGERDFPSFLTIGDVEVDGAPQFSTSYQYLKREAKGGNKHSEEFKAHVWLTFPDMHIIDVTFFLWKYDDTLPDRWRWQDYIICSNEPFAENLPLRYRPMLASPHIVSNLVFE